MKTLLKTLIVSVVAAVSLNAADVTYPDWVAGLTTKTPVAGTDTVYVQDGTTPYKNNWSQIAAYVNGLVPTFSGSGAAGLVPDPGSQTGLVLKDNGTWGQPAVFSTSANGSVPNPGAVQGYFLRDDGAWAAGGSGGGGGLTNAFDTADGIQVTGDLHVTGSITVSNSTLVVQRVITPPTTKGVSLAYPAIGLDISTNTYYEITLTGDANFTFNNAVAGARGTLVLHAGGASRTITFPNSKGVGTLTFDNMWVGDWFSWDTGTNTWIAGEGW